MCLSLLKIYSQVGGCRLGGICQHTQEGELFFGSFVDGFDILFGDPGVALAAIERADLQAAMPEI